MSNVRFHKSSSSSRRTSVCTEGRCDHKEDQKDYSIPLYLAGIVIIAILSAIFH